MEYNEYDDLLKYQIDQERIKNSYYGDPSIYEDGRYIEIFPEENDKINGTTPIFVFGTVVYLHYQGKFLILDQKKKDRVVDTLVGLGGKVKPVIGSRVEPNEKNEINNIIRAFKLGILDTEEQIKQAATREVKEETSTYQIDEYGEYTHQIIREGIEIYPELLNQIGISRIRIISNTKTECWMIVNYEYELSEEEYLFIENKVSKTNREGVLKWMNLEEALPFMSYTDQFVLKNYNNNIAVSEIRDKVNNQNILRMELDDGKEKNIQTIINNKIVFDSKINPLNKKSR